MAGTLTRPRNGKLIAGVCAALASGFGLPKWLVRLGFIIFGLVGIGELVYIILLVVLPKSDR